MRTLGMSWAVFGLLGFAGLTGLNAAEPDGGRMINDQIWLADGVEEMPTLGMGPFVRLTDGRILSVDAGHSALVSEDEGQTWTSQAIFNDPEKFRFSTERAILLSRDGSVIVAFMNMRDQSAFNWDTTLCDAPGAQLPTCVVRSADGGRTWEKPQTLHTEWTGAIRDITQTSDGTIVFTSMMLRHNPGRHSVLTYASKDDGKTWTRSNIIDLGGVGHHGGATEATIEPLGDGRIWMLMRTNWKVFWSAWSDDDGLSWRTMAPSTIDASSAPGLLERLASGRLVLVWNRYLPEGKDSFPLMGGDNQWSEVPVSNHRQELSIMFSDDDGKTWSRPIVVARHKDQISYPYLFEAAPGELWLTTMYGYLRTKLREDDFVR